MSKTNYSHQTSLPAYLENKKGKDMQEHLILYVMRKFRGKKATLKEIQHYLLRTLKISLPQSTISGRMGDLRDKGKVAFFGDTKIYLDRVRKVFEIITRKKSAKRKPVAKKQKISHTPIIPKHYRLKDKFYTLTLSDGTTWRSRNGKNGWYKKRTPRKRKTFGRSVK